MYHYMSCGLQNVWLVNGYIERDTPYGKVVAIADVEGLHQVLALNFLYTKPRLSGGEIRFLRKELNMSQKRLAEILGNDAQTIALWEKKGRAPKAADRFIRMLYLEYIDDNKTIIELVDMLNNADRIEHERKHVFKETDSGWKPEEAA